MFDNNIYEENISQFEKVTSTQADNLLTNEELAAVYIGRATCPYCRKFASKLGKLTNDISTTIYYIDGANFLDTEISSFRDKYNIPTVPGFIIRKNQEIEVRCDSSMPEDEILNMIR